MRLMVVRVGAIAGVMLLAVACSGGSQHRSSAAVVDSSCAGVAEQGPATWSGSDSVGLLTKPGSAVSVRESFQSTAAALNRWDVGGQVEPLQAQWPSLSADQVVTACWMDGAFSSRDGRSFTGALVETSGGASRLIVAGSSEQPLRVVEPPRS